MLGGREVELVEGPRGRAPTGCGEVEVQPRPRASRCGKIDLAGGSSRRREVQFEPRLGVVEGCATRAGEGGADALPLRPGRGKIEIESSGRSARWCREVQLVVRRGGATRCGEVEVFGGRGATRCGEVEVFGGRGATRCG
ncbi:MAG: hypothetical protein ACK5U8_20670, partial [Deltaproteobacteria bacterium]